MKFFNARRDMPDGLQSYCRDCSRKVLAERRATPRGKAMDLVVAARRRATDKGLAFSLSPEDVEPVLELGLCQLSGLPLRMGGRGAHAFSPSLHRVCPRKGYVPGNVLVVAFSLNCMLNQWSEALLHRIVVSYLHYKHVVTA